MNSYRLAPDIHIEDFAEQAILFVSDEDRLITVNAASADLYRRVREHFGREPFSAEAVVTLLCTSFTISAADAALQVRRLLGFGLRQGLVLKSSE